MNINDFFKSNSLEKRTLILIALLGIGIRLLAYHFATTNSSDPITRVWIAWRWLSNPDIISYGVWGPLHFYLIAFSIAILRDPIIAPVLLNIFFSVASAVLLYYFTNNEFHDKTASIIVTVCYIFYPIAVRESLMPTEIPPFLFFIILSMLLISKARQGQGSWKNALFAGISLTIAGMLRYEGWMLIPFFGFLLWKRPKLMFTFLITSLIHPVFWMTGNWIHFGDPLYSFNWASNWNINIEGANENIDIGNIINRIRFYPTSTLSGMTPIIAAFCLAGASLSLFRKEKHAIWLIPFLGLLCLFIFSTVRGSLGFEDKYTVTFGTLLIPFGAEFYKYLKINKLTSKIKFYILVLITGSIIFFSYPNMAIPGYNQRHEIKILSNTINSNLQEPDDAFISDFYGWGDTHYVALMTRLYPDKIFLALGGLHQKINLDGLYNFIHSKPAGVILLNRNSRFTNALSFNGLDKVKIGNTFLTLDRIRTMTFGKSEIGIYNYKVKENNDDTAVKN